MANDQFSPSGDAAPIPALPNRNLDLEPIKARQAADITSGPWRAVDRPSRGVQIEWGPDDGTERPICHMRWTDGMNQRIEKRIASEAEFIAHARTDIPALIAEVERLRALMPSPQPETPTEERYYALRDAVTMYAGDGIISDDAVINMASEQATIAARCVCAISDDRTERGVPQLRIVPLLSVQRIEWFHPYGSEEPYVKIADLDKISRPVVQDEAPKADDAKEMEIARFYWPKDSMPDDEPAEWMKSAVRDAFDSGRAFQRALGASRPSPAPKEPT